MIQLHRPPLPGRIPQLLAQRTRGIQGASDTKEAARQKWDGFRGSTKRVVQQTLQQMASGRQRCMYCEDSMGSSIDHLAPKDKFPHLAFEWDNLFWACSHCNSNEKRNAYPTYRSRPLLIDPVAQDPRSHIALSPFTGRFVGRSRIGKRTIAVFGLNREVLAKGRRDAYVSLMTLIPAYDACMERGMDADANEILQVVKQFPFRAVLKYLEQYASMPQSVAITPEFRAASNRRPEVFRI